MCVIDWLNTNQGFVIILLTLAYVITTICILKSNNRIHNQSIKVLLFDRRMEAYKAFSSQVKSSLWGKPDDINLIKVIQVTHGIEEVFDINVRKKANEISDHIGYLDMHQRKLEISTISGKEYHEAVNDRLKEQLAIMDLAKDLKKYMGRFLYIGDLGTGTDRKTKEKEKK